MRHVFIVNPLAGGGKSLRIIKNIAKVCENECLDYIIHYTKGPMDAMKIAMDYEDSKNIIYSVGGDGTMNEVLNGIVGSKNLFAVIPAGSGNDFIRTLDSFKCGEVPIDIGIINNRYFVNVACIGIDGEIAFNAHTIMKKFKIPPSQIYNLSIIYTFIKYKFKNISVNLGEELLKDKFTIFTICNGRYYGGGFGIAPRADISDGVFDIYYVRKISKFKITMLFLKLIKGKHEELSIVKKVYSDSIIVKSDTNIVFNVDGEIMTGRDFNIKLIKNGVTLYNNKELIDKFTNLKMIFILRNIKKLINI